MVLPPQLLAQSQAMGAEQLSMKQHRPPNPLDTIGKYTVVSAMATISHQIHLCLPKSSQRLETCCRPGNQAIACTFSKRMQDVAYAAAQYRLCHPTLYNVQLSCIHKLQHGVSMMQKDILGQGSFGIVVLVEDTEASRAGAQPPQEWAIKLLRRGEFVRPFHSCPPPPPPLLPSGCIAQSLSLSILKFECVRGCLQSRLEASKATCAALGNPSHAIAWIRCHQLSCLFHV